MAAPGKWFSCSIDTLQKTDVHLPLLSSMQLIICEFFLSSICGSIRFQSLLPLKYHPRPSAPHCTSKHCSTHDFFFLCYQIHKALRREGDSEWRISNVFFVPPSLYMLSKSIFVQNISVLTANNSLLDHFSSYCNK